MDFLQNGDARQASLSKFPKIVITLLIITK